MPNGTVNDITSIISSAGGQNGIGDDIANVINAIGGRSVPNSVTNISNPTQSAISPVFLIGGGLVLVLILFMVIKQ